MSTIGVLVHLVPKVANVIEQVTVLMVVEQCVVDEVIIQYENMFEKNAIVNLYGAALYNVKLVKNLMKFIYVNRISSFFSMPTKKKKSALIFLLCHTNFLSFFVIIIL